jgi:hypothetical protein
MCNMIVKSLIVGTNTILFIFLPSAQIQRHVVRDSAVRWVNPVFRLLTLASDETKDQIGLDSASLDSATFD